MQRKDRKKALAPSGEIQVQRHNHVLKAGLELAQAKSKILSASFTDSAFNFLTRKFKPFLERLGRIACCLQVQYSRCCTPFPDLHQKLCFRCLPSPVRFQVQNKIWKSPHAQVQVRHSIWRSHPDDKRRHSLLGVSQTRSYFPILQDCPSAEVK